MRRQKRESYPKIQYYKGRDWRKGRKQESIPKRAWLLLLLPIAVGITVLCKENKWAAEHIFAQNIYRWLSIGYSWLTSRIPFSMTECIYVFGPLIVLFVLIRFLIRWVRGPERLLIVGRFLLNVACVASVLFFAYTILCGTNYYRYSFTYYSGLTVKDSTVDELYSMCIDLANGANQLRDQISSTDDQGVFQLTTTNRETAVKARDAMENLGQQYPILSGWSAVPKSVFLSKYMSYTEITGIFFPFTMESNVNTDIADYSIPATMCHELSHLRGFMREEEANFLAYLACVESGDPQLQYSGTMLALIHAGNALYRQDPGLYQQLRNTYGDGVRMDLAANSEYWSRYKDTVVSTISNRVNDTYLKANNQADGVQSYGRMVDLLLAFWRQRTSI